jgi:hypothetical protein
MANLVPIFGSRAEPTTDTVLRQLLSEAVRHSSKSRMQIASEMTQLIGRPITINMLNAYTSLAKEPVRFPAAFINAFCQVVDDDRVQRYLLSPRLRALLELGERKLAAEMSIRNTLQHLIEGTSREAGVDAAPATPRLGGGAPCLRS